jgi:hypothetical protein
MSKKQKVENKERKVESLKPKAKKQVDPKVDENAPMQVPNDEDDSFNFGGLPERNLKKNLGCG